MLFLCVGSEDRSGPKKLDSFFRVFKCTVASGYAALTSDFRLYNTPSGVDYQVPVGTLFVEVGSRWCGSGERADCTKRCWRPGTRYT